MTKDYVPPRPKPPKIVSISEFRKLYFPKEWAIQELKKRWEQLQKRTTYY